MAPRVSTLTYLLTYSAYTFTVLYAMEQTILKRLMTVPKSEYYCNIQGITFSSGLYDLLPRATA